MNKENILRGYLVAALWSSHGSDLKTDGYEFLDEVFGIEDIAEEALKEAKTDIELFLSLANEKDIETYLDACDPEDDDPPEDWLGHDIWLTRTRSGAGFFDRSFLEDAVGERLTSVANGLGEVNLVVGDDKKLYFE